MMARKVPAFLALLTFVSFSTAALVGSPAPSPSPGHRAYVSAEAPGPFPVAEWTAEWKDASRSRTIPVRIYYPKVGSGPFPVIIMSHGLGGSRDGYRYLGERWASRGYVSVHIQHPGSDSEVLKTRHPMISMELAAANPANALNRPKDVTFALDTLTALNGRAGFPLEGRLDLKHIGVAGHSFGALHRTGVGGTYSQPAPRGDHRPLGPEDQGVRGPQRSRQEQRQGLPRLRRREDPVPPHDGDGGRQPHRWHSRRPQARPLRLHSGAGRVPRRLPGRGPHGLLGTLPEFTQAQRTPSSKDSS